LEAVFGPGGVWTRLLYRAEGYLGTEFWCEVSASRQYRIRDLWAGHQNFESFRSQFQSQYERFESWIRSDGLIEKEEFLGAYYEKFGGEDEDSVLS
jgi:hypothetical protein